MSRAELEAELARLRTRVTELEVIHHWAELKGMRLEAEVQHQARQPPIVPSSNNSPIVDGGAVMGGVAPTEEFASSWRAHTDARIKRFCALNRAGNALCAWHDSRRERRAYPPRQAPPGYLNCGCTNEEGLSIFFFLYRTLLMPYPPALFEESLARHGVGSYHPGEMVRMDPALRNPLLKLLEERFGYVDGDFEREPRTGLWLEGEGHEMWETILPSGKPAVSGSRKRGESK